jgi:acetyltransferase
MEYICMDRFHSSYRETVTLRERQLQLRLIRSADQRKLLDAFERFSAESRYCRFLSHKNALTAEEVRFFTECDGVDHLAIAAFESHAGIEGDLVAIARLIRCQDDAAGAEFAVAVIDDWQNISIGRLLLGRLRLAAAERGIQYLHGYLLPDNQRIRRTIQHVSPEARFKSEAGLLSVYIPTGAAGHARPAGWPGHDNRHRPKVRAATECRPAGTQ